MPSLPSPTNLIENNDVVICPRCKEFILLREVEVDFHDSYPFVEGHGQCQNCYVSTFQFSMERGRLDFPQIESVPLDIQFSWSIVDNRVTVVSQNDGRNYDYTYLIEELNDMCENCEREAQMERQKTLEAQGKMGRELFAIVNGTEENYHLLLVTANFDLARRMMVRDSDNRIESFDPKAPLPVDYMTRPFPVYVVSVGVRERYRIVEIVLDKKRAHRIATSVRGKVAKFDAMPTEINYQSVRFEKCFVVLDNSNDDKYFYVDRFSRRMSLYENERPAPMVTRRRRYSDSLPYRLEVAAANREEALDIAAQLAEELDDGDLDLDMFEYNVDYRMVHNNGRWEIEPCLLVANNVQ